MKLTLDNTRQKVFKAVRKISPHIIFLEVEADLHRGACREMRYYFQYDDRLHGITLVRAKCTSTLFGMRLSVETRAWSPHDYFPMNWYTPIDFYRAIAVVREKGYTPILEHTNLFKPVREKPCGTVWEVRTQEHGWVEVDVDAELVTVRGADRHTLEEVF